MAPRTPTPKQESTALDPALPQKKRARRRLVGALAVCLAAAIILPVVLDSEPRQIRDDVQVQIPSRDTPISEPLPGAGASGSREDAPAGTGKSAPAPESGASDTDAKSDAKPEPGPVAKSDANPESKPDAKPMPGTSDAKPAAKGDGKGQSKADAKAAAKSVAYLLQIGAFASEKGASEQSLRARQAGLKAYTEKVQTPNGERIRVRVGPFASREAAEQARGKLRSIGVDAALIGP